ncbi:unnamed protein product, partial [Amoebophrya sp. A25]
HQQVVDPLVLSASDEQSLWSSVGGSSGMEERSITQLPHGLLGSSSFAEGSSAFSISSGVEDTAGSQA